MIIRKLLFAFILFYCHMGMGQKCNFPFPPGETCAEAPVICDFDGYCFSNQSFQNAPTPSSFCGQIENDGWVSFRAFTTFLDIEVIVSNCISADNERGIQAVMFSVSDCNNYNSGYTAVSNCLNPVFEGTSDILSATNLIPGNIYHILIDGKGGDDCDIEFQVLAGLTSPVAEILAQSYLCENSLLTLGSEATDLDAYTYIWETDIGNFLTADNQPTVVVDAIGNYGLTIIDQQYGCIDSTIIEVVAAPSPVVNIQTPDILDCLAALTILIDGTNSDLGFESASWEGPGIVTTSDNGFVAEVFSPGLYTLTVTVDSTGCTTIDSVMVSANIDFPVAEVVTEETELNCLTDRITLDGSNSSMGNDFNSIWTTDTGEIIGTPSNPAIDVEVEGIYTLTVRNVNNGCISTAETIITNNPAEPTALALDVNAPCFGETDGEVIIQGVMGGTPPYLFQLDEQPFSNSPSYLMLNPNSYLVRVQDLTGCEYDTLVTINSTEELTVDLGSDVELELGDSLMIEADISLPFDSIYWTPEICDTCINFTTTPLEDIVYTVKVVDENGCVDTDEIILKVIKNRFIFVPNAFSPNFDGNNDVFMIYGGKDVAEIETFQIYDRWGNLLFTQDHFQPNDLNFAWDGMFRNKVLKNQVFTWYAKIRYIDGLVENKTGDVTLIY